MANKLVKYNHGREKSIFSAKFFSFLRWLYPKLSSVATEALKDLERTKILDLAFPYHRV